MKKITTTLFGLLTVLMLTAVVCNQTSAEVYNSKSLESDSVIVEYTINSVQLISDSLVSEVDSYIKSVAPKSKMTAENIIDKCLEYDFDITLLLSQAHIETHFGTTGRNVFGLYGKRYSHPDHAVEDYLDLMTRKFIINRTTEELLASGFTYENNKKAKYAENPNYCIEIGRVRKDIINNTKILDLYKSLQDISKI